MQIVLNADDFGYSADTVAATVECFKRGLLTSATIQPGMPATPAALEFARVHDRFSFGVHLTIVGDGIERPLSARDDVAALIEPDGTFKRTRDARVSALLGRLPVEQLEREVAAQIDSVRAAGVKVSHVDSHRHLHKFAPFRKALQRVLPRFGIRRVRSVQDIYLRRPLLSPTYWLGGAWRHRLAREFVTTDHFYMPTSAADVDWHSLVPSLSTLTGSLEVGVHPGDREEWRRQERVTLELFVGSALAHGHRLVSWDEIEPT